MAVIDVTVIEGADEEGMRVQRLADVLQLVRCHMESGNFDAIKLCQWVYLFNQILIYVPAGSPYIGAEIMLDRVEAAVKQVGSIDIMRHEAMRVAALIESFYVIEANTRNLFKVRQAALSMYQVLVMLYYVGMLVEGSADDHPKPQNCAEPCPNGEKFIRTIVPLWERVLGALQIMMSKIKQAIADLMSSVKNYLPTLNCHRPRFFSGVKKPERGQEIELTVTVTAAA